MSEHNTFTAEPGKIVIYGEWTGSEYQEYQGYIRAVISVPGGEDEPTINLTYSDGVGAASQANVVENIEIITGNDDYWRAQFDPVRSDSLPEQITRPVQGDVVWLAIYDTSISEYRFHLGFVRAIPGAPTDQTPNLNVSYYDDIAEADVNANQVVPEPDNTGTDDYWWDLPFVSG